jgi:predicted phage terminase large subunit-like protein
MERFRDFIARVHPRFVWYPHISRLADILERVANGEIKRLMVFMPPRHGKTLLASHLFPAYYLVRYPQQWVGMASYGAALAHTLSRAAQGYFREGGGEVRRTASAASHWETTQGGGIWAAGVGGPLTGKGGHLLTLDDPIKNAAEAASTTIRAAQRDWYASTFYTRAEPNAAVVIIQTRWHQEDLSGWLLAEESQDDQPEGWHIVNLPALYETPLPIFPAACTVEVDWRSEGEALCPPRFDAPRLAKIRQRLGSYFWAALYQQQPRPADGNYFKRDWFTIVPAAPALATRIRYWDLAATANGGDYTAGVRLALTPDGMYTVEDVVRGQWSPGARDSIIRQTADTDGTNVKIIVEQEPGSSGVAATAALVKALAGYAVRGERATGSKAIRAAPFAAQTEAGNVRLVRGAWNKAFIEEMLAFPTAAHDDQVDAAAGAFNALARERRVKVI